MKPAIIKTMQSLCQRHDAWRVFSDFVELLAVSIANACDRFNPDRDKREARYLEIAKGYTQDELQAYARLLGMVTQALEAEPCDLLGEVFMEMDLGSKWHGQFFTPYSLSQASAQMLTVNLDSVIQERGFITVSEPAAGGGAMLIAMAEALQAKGYNFQTQMHCTAQDLDLKSVHMCYVQLSLLGIPATIIHGNTLTLEQRSVWHTPMHFIHAWPLKLRAKTQQQEAPASHSTPAADAPQPLLVPPPSFAPAATIQPMLF